jgi:hypothetical protein
MVTNMKRDGELDKKFQSVVTHAKYWSAGRKFSELSDAEKAEPHEGHYDAKGNPTTPGESHYGHRTVTGKDGVVRRYDYQKQHVLHPRIVPVKVGKETHHIPTDSRFKDNEFLPTNRFKSKNGKDAGAILITTPTHSTSDVQHHSNFTHNVEESHIQHAMNNNGEYEIDKPEEQEASRGNEYKAPEPPPMTAEEIQKRQRAKVEQIRSNPEFKKKLKMVQKT